MRPTIVAILIIFVPPAFASPTDAEGELRAIPIHLKRRLDGLNDRASLAGGIYLDVTARAAKPLPPDPLVRTQDVIDHRVEDANLPASRPEYVAYAEELEAIVFEYSHLAKDLADVKANALELHCLRWAEVFRERAAILRKTIAETDPEERRIAEKLEENPRDCPVRNPFGETNSLLRFRNELIEREIAIDPVNLAMEQLLNKRAVPLWIIVVMVATGLWRNAPRKRPRRQGR